MALSDWNYTIGIRFFQSETRELRSLSDLVVNDLEQSELIAGVACRAARELLDLSQADLKAMSGVGKKSINDFENAFVALRPELVRKLRAALETDGARFVVGDDVFGVIVQASRELVDQRSRSPNKNAGQTKARPEPQPRRVVVD
jgi:transcriptional regulator with XRE-family HTH domain